MSISKEEAAETLKKATAEMDAAQENLKQAAERANRARSNFNAALRVNGQFVEK